MKFSLPILSLALASFVDASPMSVGDKVDRSFGATDDNHELMSRAAYTANEYLDGGCEATVLVFARGTLQLGNLGATPGQILYNQIKAALGDSNVAVQGVNYDADQAHGTLPEGVDPTAAANMATLITTIANNCASSNIVVSGYSQGAAMVHASIKQLSTAVKARVNAAVTFGDTRNEQDGGEIPGFDTSKTLIICNDGDLVCDGTLTITAAHLAYGPTVPEAVSFIESKI